MKRKVLLIDTSILVVWLQVPGMGITGNKHLDYDAVHSKLAVEQEAGTTFVLPMATIIETGNHITHISNWDDRRLAVNRFADLLIQVANNKKPWMLYYDGEGFSSPDELVVLAENWRENGIYELSLGDASILKVANKLKLTFDVEVYTDDDMLEQLSRVPLVPEYVPRRKTRS